MKIKINNHFKLMLIILTIIAMIGIEIHIESTMKNEFENIEDSTINNQMFVINKKLNDNKFAEDIIIDLVYEYVKEKIHISYDVLDVLLKTTNKDMTASQMKAYINENTTNNEVEFNVIKYDQGIDSDSTGDLSYIDIKNKILLLKKKKIAIITKESIFGGEHENRIYLFYNEKLDAILYAKYELNELERSFITDERKRLEDEMNNLLENDIFFMGIIDINGKSLYTNTPLNQEHFDGKYLKKEKFDILKSKVNTSEDIMFKENGVEEKRRISTKFINGKYITVSKVVDDERVIDKNLLIMRMMLTISIIVAIAISRVINPNKKIITIEKKKAGAK